MVEVDGKRSVTTNLTKHWLRMKVVWYICHRERTTYLVSQFALVSFHIFDFSNDEICDAAFSCNTSAVNLNMKSILVYLITHSHVTTPSQ